MTLTQEAKLTERLHSFRRMDTSNTNTDASTCYACLTEESLLDITETNPELHQVLSICVPEVKWDNCSLLCQNCTLQLEFMRKFRKMCLAVDAKRRGDRPASVKDARGIVEPLEIKTEVEYVEADFENLMEVQKEFHEDINPEAGQGLRTQELECKIEIQYNNLETDRLVMPVDEQNKIEASDKFNNETNNTVKCVGLTNQQENSKPPVKKKNKKKPNKPKPKHSEPKPEVCEFCDRQFSTWQYLSFHVQAKHMSEQSFTCSLCDKSFSSWRVLHEHKTCHSSEKKYVCKHCNRSFKFKNSRRVHTLIKHVDPINWKHLCKLCGERFHIKESLNTHIAKHNGERSFACDMCGKAFYHPGSIRKHRKCHLAVHESNVQSVTAEAEPQVLS